MKTVEAKIATAPGCERASLERYVHHHRARNLRTGSIYQKVVPVHDAATLVGIPLIDAEAADLEQVAIAWLERYAPQTVKNRCINLQQYLRWLHNVNDLPPVLNEALRPRLKLTPFSGIVITDEQRDQLLRSCDDFFDRYLRGIHRYATFPFERVMWQAIFASLWDLGLRAGELLALEPDCVSFESGIATVALPDDDDPTKYLKTGPRVVYGAFCEPYLKAWLAIRADLDVPTKRLFVGFRHPNPGSRLRYKTLNRMMKEMCRAASLPELAPHDFRHTCATVKARLNWNDIKMRRFFGWSKDSNMPSHYAHLVSTDIIAQVRRDAGLDPDGQKPAAQAVDEIQQLRSTLRKLIG